MESSRQDLRFAVRSLLKSPGFAVVSVITLALAMSRLLGGLVVGVSATDPLTFTTMPLLLGLVALVANLVPARRATRLDPAKTLRAD